ncbi:MAG: SpoIID/LytB domain-containing protein [Gemmatimonadaceae bacterium]
MLHRSRRGAWMFLSVALTVQACSENDPLAPPTAATPAAAPSLALTPGPVRDIRIGVVQAAASIALGSTGDYSIIDKLSGLVLMSGSNGVATVTLTTAPIPYYRLQVVCGSATVVAGRKAAAEAAGYVTYTEFVPAANCTRLFLGQFAAPPASTWTPRSQFRTAAISAGHAGNDSFWKVVAVGATEYRVTRGSTVTITTNPVGVTSSDGVVTVNGTRYRGKGEAIHNGAGSLAGVNELPVEQYLYGVVPRELGPIAYPEIEAQKAQAIAARTYALAGLNKRASNGYDLRATTDDQVYGGYAAEHPVSNAAVDATAGEVVTYGGALISALFSSTSGGHTANNEEAFAGGALSYLRGVPDAERGKALEHVPSLEVFRSRANATSLRGLKEGDFESNWARYHRWTFEWTNAEISSVISTFAQKQVGRVLEINVVERGPSGRAILVEYVTDGGTFTSVRDGTRAALKYISANGSPANLLSTLFFVEPVIDRRSKEVSGFRVYGAGFGHGVGLAQTGAVGMAEKGHLYHEILKHYYHGVQITTWY